MLVALGLWTNGQGRNMMSDQAPHSSLLLSQGFVWAPNISMSNRGKVSYEHEGATLLS